MVAVQVTAAGNNTLKGPRHLVRTSTGKLYAVFEADAKVQVWYSLDGAVWAQKDAGGSPDCFADSPIGAAIDSVDILHIVYYHDDYPGDGGLDYITFNTIDGGAKDDAFNIEEEAMDQKDADNTTYGCAISIDLSDKPHACFVDSDSAKGTDYDTIYYANKIGANWTNPPIEVEGVSTPANCDYPDLTIDADNKPQICYHNVTDSDIGAAHGDANDAGAFTLQDVDADGDSDGPGIVIDSDGNTYIGYHDTADSQLHAAKLLYRGDWNAGWLELDSNIACPASNNISVVANLSDIYFFFEDAGNDIHYVSYKGAAWTDEGDLEPGTFNNVRAKWAFWVDNDSGGALVGTSWAQVGNSFGIAGIVAPALAALSSTRVAFIDSILEQLRAYDFDGTDWALVGNSFGIAGIGPPALAALSSTRVAFIDATLEQLRTYDFDGADWALVGNSFDIAGCGNPSLAALSSTRVAFIDSTLDQLRTYDFDGADWALVGNSLGIAGIGNLSLAALSNTRVAFIDATLEQLRTYDFDGADWAQVRGSLGIAGCGNPSLAALSSARIAFIDDSLDQLRTYEFTKDPRSSSAELDYVFADEEATPDIWWNKITLAAGPANLKSVNAVTTANIKSINAVLIANVKSINAIA